MDITKEQRKNYRDKVIESIKKALYDNRERITDLGDIGNEIGIAVGSITCKEGKDLNIWSFEQDDFEHGFTHGYSLMDGSH